jgi:hypothetical protein
VNPFYPRQKAAEGAKDFFDYGSEDAELREEDIDDVDI